MDINQINQEIATMNNEDTSRDVAMHQLARAAEEFAAIRLDTLTYGLEALSVRQEFEQAARLRLRAAIRAAAEAV